MIAAKEEMHYLLDDLDINWAITETERRRFKMMWNVGESVEYIADVLGRKPLEVGLLIIEQAELGEIKPRKHGVY